MKKLKDFNFKKKNVLVRCDFNVPVSDQGEVLDEFRIKMTLPTIEYLIEKGARVILMSHLETKEGKSSLQKIISILEKLLKRKIEFLSDYLTENARRKIERMPFDTIVLLENLRFHKGEEENDKVFAKKISALGDIFVNEAFSVCHRAHASIVGVPKHLPKVAGLLLEKEVKILSQLLKKPVRPFVAIIGGIKIKTKIRAIINALKIADHLLLGSKIGEALLVQKGILLGRHFPEEKLIDKIDLTSPKLHISLDGVIALKDIDEQYLRKGGVGTLRKEEEVFDIGPETIKIFKKVISDAKTILWNGPLGMYEDKRFEVGTKEIASAIVRNYSALKIAGGGDTVAAIHKFDLAEKFDFISTGGGAMLEFLTGEELVGIEALN